MRSIPIAVLTAAACLHATAATAGAQACATGVIEGFAKSEAGTAIAGVQLTVAGGSSVTSDSAGRFRIPGACAGPSVVSARRLGFAATTLNVIVAPASVLHVDVMLVPVAQQLRPVVVHAQESASASRLREFFVRRQRLPGHFLTRTDLEPFDNAQLTDVLRSRVPGLQASASSGHIRNRVRLRGQRCAPMVWLDGMSTPAGEFDLDVIQTSTVAAIEVYSGAATIPAEFRTPFGRDACGGAIVVWSRIGRDQWDPPPRESRRTADAGAQLPVFQPDEVDAPARVDSAAMPTPLYPDSLHAFKVEGAAIAEFVVDTTGLPVVGSIRILSASAPAFGAAVLRAIAIARFIPARKANRAVRQLMQLPFEFTMDRRS